MAEHLRITAELVDGAAGSRIWSESLDASASDPIDVQERIARTIADKIEPELTGSSHRFSSQIPNANLAAKSLYLQGRYHLERRTEEGLQCAVDFFEKALAEDAQFALAHSGLADAWTLLAHYGVLGPSGVWTKAAFSAAAAVRLDGHSAEAATSMAHLRATQDWDWAGAEQDFQRGIQLNPRYATARHWYATSCLVPMARLDDALRQLEVAQSLDPVSSIIARDLAMMHFYRRDFEEALDQCDHAVELNPDFAPVYHALGLIQEQRKDLDEAAAAFRRVVDLSPTTPRAYSALARTLAVSGCFDQSLETLALLERLADRRYVSPFEFVTIPFALGDSLRGYQWLKRACDDRCFELLSLRVDPRFDGLRHESSFVTTTRGLGRDC